jgi:aminopeptidase N
MRFLILFVVCALTTFAFSQRVESEFKTDVLHYQLRIVLSDSHDTIVGHQTIKLVVLDNLNELSFDLKGLNDQGKGMVVSSVKIAQKALVFRQSFDQLLLNTGNISKGDSLEIDIHYRGVPIDGLIIGKNRFGERTFFGDNWPNRAHNWFACNDHPSDKARFSFEVYAPKKYEVIANGGGVKITDEGDNMLKWEYTTLFELPTKVAVIGVADFSITTFGPMNSEGVEVSAYVYPQNEKEGFYDLSLAPDVMSWFERKIAPYPFERLANVQSTTRYGGMENAGCIFYDEKAIDGKRSMENLIAHEIAHQWFGNSASENGWAHLWLSEGFATYLTNVYIQETKGQKAFYDQLEKDKRRILAFYRKYPLPVVDTLTEDLNQLLNANAYQKGSWFLHMLRHEIGDSAFWLSVRTYYETYKYSNASTTDFKQVVEQISKKDLDRFFEQWLNTPGHPFLKLDIKKKGRSARINVEEYGTGYLYHFDLEIEFLLEDGTTYLHKVRMDKPLYSKKLDLPKGFISYKIDPDHKILFETR